jgi:hypothetical protein
VTYGFRADLGLQNDFNSCFERIMLGRLFKLDLMKVVPDDQPDNAVTSFNAGTYILCLS